MYLIWFVSVIDLDILVYVLSSKINELFTPITNTDIPTHIAEGIEQERLKDEARLKDIAEAHLYVRVWVLVNCVQLT